METGTKVAIYTLKNSKVHTLKNNRYMKILSIILLLNICFINSLTSQTAKTMQELLMSTNWEPQDFFDEGDCGYIKYTKTKDIYIEKINNTIDRVYSNYYLSSSPDTIFDSNKVGKNNNGKYIIRDGGKYVFISEILKLTDTELVLRNLTPGFTTTGKVTTYLKTDMDF